jgi:hypothetical protein
MYSLRKSSNGRGQDARVIQRIALVLGKPRSEVDKRLDHVCIPQKASFQTFDGDSTRLG